MALSRPAPSKRSLSMKPALKILKKLSAVFLLLALAAPASAEFADYKGHKVYYQVMGQGEPALVLIHGWSCDHTIWRFNAPGLAKKRKLVLVDMPGHGQSDKPRVDYTLAYLAGGVAEAVKASGVKNPALAGHSMGAPVGREVIRQNPGLVSGLILVDGALDRVPQDPKARAAWEKQYADVIAGMQKDFRAAVRPFVESMLGPAMTPQLKKIIMDQMQSADPYVGVSAMQAMSDPHNWRIEKIDAPTLAMYVKNEYLPPDIQEWLRALFPKLTYRQWENVGHFFMMEKPDAFNRQVEEYLSTL